jgi:hypothetical protein
LDDVLGGLDDRRMAERVNGDWTRKDVVAHIGGWEARAVRLFAIVHGERDFDPEEPAETDAFNAWWFERNRDRPVNEVRASEAEAFRALVDLVATAHDADLFDPGRFPFLEGQQFERVVRENTIEHYPDHDDQLRVATTSEGR